MKKIVLLHPIIFALYPVFALQVRNADLLKLTDILSTAATVLFLLCIVWFLIYRGIKLITSTAVAEKSAMVTSVVFLLLFSYGHVINWLILAAFKYEQRWLEMALNSGLGFIVLMIIWIGVLGSFVFLVLKAQHNIKTINGSFTIMAVTMMLFVLIDTIRGQISINESLEPAFISAWKARLDAEFPPGQQSDAGDGQQPDIYYIILDGYGRQDILQEIYQYDNSEFLDFLTQSGFYIAQKSHTNYPQTALSLSSTMNFMYLNEMPIQIDVGMKAFWPLRAMFRDSRLFRFLKSHNYLIRSIPTGYFLTEILNADITVAPEGRLNPFQVELLDATPLPTMGGLIGLPDQSDRYRNRILFGLENIPAPADQTQPLFTFVHIVCPHPPFVFDAQGNAVKSIGVVKTLDGDAYVGNPDDYVEEYRQQVIFINRRIESVIDQIISQSQRSVLIIVQSDHGPGSRLYWKDWRRTYLPERMSILNAYYFYDQDYHRLYPSITPVNSFRIILDQYFGAKYDLLEDRSYFASMGSPYAFTDVTQYLISP